MSFRSRAVGVATAWIVVILACVVAHPEPEKQPPAPPKQQGEPATVSKRKTIDALAAEGTVFENAYSASGWTLPSVATLMTGHEPRQHGATRPTRAMDAGLPSLAALLKKQGYETRAYVSHVLLHPRYGMHLGFDIFDASVLEVGHPHLVSTAEPLTNLALRDLARTPVKGPLFLWVHYFDPHYEYIAQQSVRPFGERPIDRYDGEIVQTDRQIARLIDGFRQLGLYKNTVVVFTADHGEEFQEHGGIWHDTIYEEVLRVPLIVRVPGRVPGKSPEPARQVDLMPTVLAALGVDPPADLPGRDLLTTRDSDAGPQALFFERDVPSLYRQRGVLLGQAKLIVVERVPDELVPPGPPEPPPQPGLRAGVYLFDLAKDPQEKRNRVEEDPELAAKLLALLRGHFEGEIAEGPNVDLDPELQKRLRALGYLE